MHRNGDDRVLLSEIAPSDGDHYSVNVGISSSTSSGVPRGLKLSLVAVIVVTVGVVLFYLSGFIADPDARRPQENINIWCGDLLEAVQLSGIYNDSKIFVDKPALHRPSTILARFKEIGGRHASIANLTAFLKTNFAAVGDDVMPNLWTPGDYDPSHLKWAGLIVNNNTRVFAESVHSMWQHMTKQINHYVYDYPDQHTLIALKYPYMVVPGGRFNECYYWDNLWIVAGTLVSGMTETARIVVDNLLGLVEQYGFVPNGNRKYYLNRSQPPVLSLICAEYVTFMLDESNSDSQVVKEMTEFLTEALPLLEAEYNNFISTRTVLLQTNQGDKVHLTRYRANWTSPRPEAYRQDYELGVNLSPQAKADLYMNVASAAESGWDFSSRWLQESGDYHMSTIHATDIVPVDLNAILYSVERWISAFGTFLRQTEIETKYRKLAAKRLDAMNQVLFCRETKQWRDYDMRAERFGQANAVSNFWPLWAGAFDEDTPVGNLTEIVSVLKENLLFRGGIATTLTDTQQQWDFPSAWAPQQDVIITALIEGPPRYSVLAPVATDGSSSSSSGSKNRHVGGLDVDAGMDLAQKWIASNHKGWCDTREDYDGLFEKYQCNHVGVPAGGGEYNPQKGFGWTNAVALKWIYKLNEGISLGNCGE